MRIAVPSNLPGGMGATISQHFGHCEVFTLVDVEQGAPGTVSVVPNQPHEQGGCLAPVQVLKGHGVDAMVAGGMGARPLAGFQQMGIDVYYSGNAGSVADAVNLITSGQAHKFGPAQVCGGGGSCGGHHH